MNITLLQNIFSKFCADRGFVPKEPIGLLSPVFPNEFNVSGGHNYALDFLKETLPIMSLQKYSLFEKCFRRIDLDKVGYSYHHLSFFHVALFAYAGFHETVYDAIKEGIANMTYLLTQVLLIPKEKLVVTVFNGGRFRNFDLDRETLLGEWLKYGEYFGQIIPIKGRRNLVFSETEGAAVCPTCEIFFDRGMKYEKSNRFVEIGSVNLYKFLFHLSENSLASSPNWVQINVVGVERILMVLQEADTIYDINCISPIIKIIEESLQHPIETEIFSSAIRSIADTLRSIIIICSEGIEIDSTPQGKILKKLVKHVVSQMRYLYIYDTFVLEKLIVKAVEMNGELYPNMSDVKDKVLNMLSFEIDKWEPFHERV